MAAGGRSRARARAIICGGMLAALLASCAKSSPEARLRATIAGMQTALSERRAADVMAVVAEIFEGPSGMDRAALHNLLRAQQLANRHIGVTTGPLDIEIRGDRATVRFAAAVSGGRGGVLPQRMQAYSVVTGWQDRNGEWRLYYAEWQPRL